MKNLSNIQFCLLAIVVAVLLTGCSAHCNCPDCPKTTVINPQPSTTVVTPQIKSN